MGVTIELVSLTSVFKRMPALSNNQEQKGLSPAWVGSYATSNGTASESINSNTTVINLTTLALVKYFEFHVPLGATNYKFNLSTFGEQHKSITSEISIKLNGESNFSGTHGIHKYSGKIEIVPNNFFAHYGSAKFIPDYVSKITILFEDLTADAISITKIDYYDNVPAILMTLVYGVMTKSDKYEKVPTIKELRVLLGTTNHSLSAYVVYDKVIYQGGLPSQRDSQVKRGKLIEKIEKDFDLSIFHKFNFSYLNLQQGNQISGEHVVYGVGYDFIEVIDQLNKPSTVFLSDSLRANMQVFKQISNIIQNLENLDTLPCCAPYHVWRSFLEGEFVGEVVGLLAVIGYITVRKIIKCLKFFSR